MDPPNKGAPHVWFLLPAATAQCAAAGMQAPKRILAPWQVDIGPTKIVAPVSNTAEVISIMGMRFPQVKGARAALPRNGDRLG